MDVRNLKNWIVPVGLLGALWAMGCGSEARDRPEDCRAGEYYDAGVRLCLTCPAVIAPTCREGCGFRVREDERGCPVAQCAEACDLCEEGEVFSDDTLSCEPVS
jgi:hypothetical protein